MTTRYFGPIVAAIDSDEKRVTLSFAPVTYQNGTQATRLDNATRTRCLSWCIDEMQPLLANGFTLSTARDVHQVLSEIPEVQKFGDIAEVSVIG